ncbi:MAG TPA: flagellar basal body P-ring formation chaperone FlgA [Lacipirellulaceae bacterium]|nr:flagellar basal body P-ring formation chaperone FlgA [Lacipirellulaceae bacterium]
MNYFVSFVSFVLKDNMNNIGRALSVAITIALLTGLQQASAATVDIRLHEQVTASAPVIRLGDVARIVTADRQRARELSSLLLMPAPAPGTQRFLRKREVEDLLAAHGEDLSQLRLDGASQVAITTRPVSSGNDEGRPIASRDPAAPMNRHAAILAGYAEPAGSSQPANLVDNDLHDEVKRIIANYIVEKTGQAAEWRVTCQVSARYLAQLDAATSPPVCSGGTAPWTGRQQFIISFATAEGPARIPVYADLAPAAVPVVVAIQPIARGAVITAADVELQCLEAVPAATSRRLPLTSVEQIVGMEARQAIAAGDVIFTDKVQSPIFVKRGELITVGAQGGGIRVTTTARARQDGARGELVQLESLETREIYDARVTGFREAAVFTAAAARVPDRENSPRTASLSPASPSVKQIETTRR